jgi:hypothetical protein
MRMDLARIDTYLATDRSSMSSHRPRADVDSAEAAAARKHKTEVLSQFYAQMSESRKCAQ